MRFFSSGAFHASLIIRLSYPICPLRRRNGFLLFLSGYPRSGLMLPVQPQEYPSSRVCRLTTPMREHMLLANNGEPKRTGGGGSPAFAIPPARGSIASCPPPTMGTGRERPGPEEKDCHPTSKAFRSLENQKCVEQDSFNFSSARIPAGRSLQGSGQGGLSAR